MNAALTPGPMAIRPGRETSIGLLRPSAFWVSTDQAGLGGIYAWNPTILVVVAAKARTTMGSGFEGARLASAVAIHQGDDRYTCTDARSGGCVEFRQPATLCEAHHVPLSGHGAHAIHLPPAHTSPRVRNLECFHDHVWIEHMLLEGAHVQHHCVIPANLPRVGHGLAFVAADAWRFRIV